MRDIKTQDHTIEILYLALQYLSNAARCYLSKQEEDRHLDLRFSSLDNSFMIRLLEDSKCVFYFNFERFTLEWVLHNRSKIMRLNGSSHKQILKWIRMVTKESNFNKTYKYISKQKDQFPITDDYVFHLSNIEPLRRMIQMRTIAHNAMQTMLFSLDVEDVISVRSFVLSSRVRFAYPGIENVFIELGYMIPDTVFDEHYYYLTCCKGNRKVHVTKMQPLRIGYWYDDRIKGAVLPANNFSEKVVITFFQEALSAYLNKINN